MKSVGYFLFWRVKYKSEIYKMEQVCMTETCGVQRMLPFGAGLPIGASGIPVGTRLCCIFVEHMAARDVAHH